MKNEKKYGWYYSYCVICNIEFGFQFVETIRKYNTVLVCPICKTTWTTFEYDTDVNTIKSADEKYEEN